MLSEQRGESLQVPAIGGEGVLGGAACCFEVPQVRLGLFREWRVVHSGWQGEARQQPGQYLADELEEHGAHFGVEATRIGAARGQHGHA